MPESRKPCTCRVSVAAAADRTAGLPLGTRVVRNPVEPCSCCDDRDKSVNRRPALFGTVMTCSMEFSRGCFSVRWDSGIWEAQLDVCDVSAVSPEQEAAIRAQRRAPATSPLLRREAR